MATTVEALQAALDQRPRDWQTRLVLADALDEAAGGECALGHAQRWMARHQRRPHQTRKTWDWWCFLDRCDYQPLMQLHAENRVDRETFGRLFAASVTSGWDCDCAYKEYADRQAAEADLAQALWLRRG